MKAGVAVAIFKNKTTRKFATSADISFHLNTYQATVGLLTGLTSVFLHLKK